MKPACRPFSIYIAHYQYERVTYRLLSGGNAWGAWETLMSGPLPAHRVRHTGSYVVSNLLRAVNWALQTGWQWDMPIYFGPVPDVAELEILQ